MLGWDNSSEAAAIERLREKKRGNVRTNLETFTRQLVNFVVDSLKEALAKPEWRVTAIEEAKDGWRLLNRRLARDDVPQELQVICARLVFLFDSVGFPADESEAVEAKLRNLIEQIDGIYPPSPAG